MRDVFASGYFGLAAKVVEFEQRIASQIGAGAVVATNSGTSALHLALDALGIGRGDEVIVPSLTFVACFQAIAATGATPVACDVLSDSLLIDVQDARRRITPRTKAIMPVHYGGRPCDMDALLELARPSRLRVVEDAAHAFGSSHRGRRVGSFGDVACFSFDSIKNITCGEGGAVVCRDDRLAGLMRRKRLLGIERKGQTSTSWKERGWHFEVETLGFRYHMSAINAAIGIVQLRKLAAFVARRRAICARYDAALAEERGISLIPGGYDEIAPHIYVVRVLDGLRDALMNRLKERDIETGINYVPNHLHPFFRRPGIALPVTDRAYGEILTLPLHCELADADVDVVVDVIREFLRESRQARVIA